VRLEGELTGGTADVIYGGKIDRVICDWKTGIERDHYGQLAAYAYCSRCESGMPESGVIYVVVLYVREQKIEITKITAVQIEAFAQQLAQALAQAGEVYRPGEVCVHCPRRLECDARLAQLDKVRDAVAVLRDGGSKAISREKIAEYWSYTRLIKSVIEDFEAAVRAEVAHGPLAISETKQLEIREYEREVLDPRVTIQSLTREGWEPEDIYPVLAVSKSSLSKAMAYKQGFGGAKAKAEFFGKLEAEGGIARVAYSSLKQVKRSV
jgi:hypothetical protein